MPPLNWTCTPQERAAIDRITGRAVRLAAELGIDIGRPLDLMMDVTACHLNGCPLDFAALIEADDSNFAHDVFGITRHINRRDGTLRDCFIPRFAKANTMTDLDRAHEKREQLQKAGKVHIDGTVTECPWPGCKEPAVAGWSSCSEHFKNMHG